MLHKKFHFHQNWNPLGKCLQKSQSWKWGVGQTEGFRKLSLAKYMFYPYWIVSDCPKNEK